MAVISKQVTIGLGSIVLAALLSVSVAEAQSGATAIPVPAFTQAPANLPTESELQATLVNRQQFMVLVDDVTHGVFVATEQYREYIKTVKMMLAGCEVESDTSGFENTGFEGLIAEGGEQCRRWVADFNQQARVYAARLDEAQEFQKTVQKVGARVLGQIDRIQIMLHSKKIKRAVDQGIREIDNTRQMMKPWMGSKTNNQ